MSLQKNNYHLKVKDFSVSGESFELVENIEFGFLETIPKPDINRLSEYYESEDYISHTDSRRNLFENIYHSIRRFSLKRKLSLINQFDTKEKVLLDIGCGTGDFLQTAQTNNWEVTGIEPNEKAREIANKKTVNVVLDSTKLECLDKESFDVITLWHVLEHLPNLEEQVGLFKSLLKPDGFLVIAVPNFKSYDAQHYKKFWAAYDVPRHLWHFNQKSISRLMEKYGLNVTFVKPMWFDAFYVSLLSEKYRTGKMNFFKGLAVGLKSNVKALSTKEVSSLIYVIKNGKS